MNPLDLARAEVVRTVSDAGERLHCLRSPDPNSFRFRSDGKGGEWATPYPLIVRVEPLRLAAACAPNPYLEQVQASGGWLAVSLSKAWRDMVRSYAPTVMPADFSVPPIPDFPARILPEAWRFQALLSHPQAALAARLDGGNPWVKLLHAQRMAACSSHSEPSRLLINECALLFQQLDLGSDAEKTARQALHLAELFLAAPCEAPTISNVLHLTRIFLGI